MGDIHNIFQRSALGCGLGRRATASTLVGLLIAAVATAGHAADPPPGPTADAPNESPALERRPATEAVVSTSPGTSARGRLADPSQPSVSEADGGALPLTRAATRLRIERMTPVEWLSAFGPIQVGQIE